MKRIEDYTSDAGRSGDARKRFTLSLVLKEVLHLVLVAVGCNNGEPLVVHVEDEVLALQENDLRPMDFGTITPDKP